MAGIPGGERRLARRRLRLGMVGGGQGALIGAVHRLAARMDERFELVAGCFSSTAERSRASGLELGIAPERTYDSYQAMVQGERRRSDGIDAVTIVTPNDSHWPIARAFLKAGFHIICDKPMTTTVRDAERLAALVEETGRAFVLTHNYTGYPMVRQARAMVQAGELGRIRIVMAEYAQDWLATPVEAAGQKQAEWRTDPARSGPSCTTGDIGTHAINLASYITGLDLLEVAAEVRTRVEGRRLDDNVGVLLRFADGATGMLWASQVAPGNQNNLRLRIYGDKAGLAWSQEDPNYLHLTPLGEPPRLVSRARGGARDAAAVRLPRGLLRGVREPLRGRGRADLGQDRGA